MNARRRWQNQRMAPKLSASGWTQDSMKSCSFVARQGFVPHCGPYPRRFSAAGDHVAELALAYTDISNGGWRPNAPHILERIEERTVRSGTRNGSPAAGKIVIKPETAYEVHSCLSRWSGTGKAAHSQYGLRKSPGRRAKSALLIFRHCTFCRTTPGIFSSRIASVRPFPFGLKRIDQANGLHKLSPVDDVFPAAGSRCGVPDRYRLFFDGAPKCAARLVASRRLKISCKRAGARRA